ncbi:MAG: exodeoxyribonuclease III [Gammaproteobacteria bacterium]|nr:exodeoxyribonuclease III [Gammaproteobacteria bacterium]
MKVASWNINSLRVRLPHVLEWLDKHQPDVLGLQETKLPDHDFPADAFFDAGYDVRFSGQKTYNGVAFVFRDDSVGQPDELVTSLSEYEDSQKRIIAGTFGDTRIYNLYVPNGQSVGSEKYEYKLDWLTALRLQVEADTKQFDKIVLMGDFNIAPEDRDIHDPERWNGKIMCSDAERGQLQQITELGFTDLLRKHNDSNDVFSWWDYRMGAFERNNGLRIDLVLGSAAMVSVCEACHVDSAPRALDRPSDHAPVWAKFAQ